MTAWRISTGISTLICFVLYLSPVLAYMLRIEEAPLGYLWSLLFGLSGILFLDPGLRMPAWLRKLGWGCNMIVQIVLLLLTLGYLLQVKDARLLFWVYPVVHLLAAVLLAGFVIIYRRGEIRP
ncbi:hypothetical protein [Paenibacillus radicis (ex Gao et al. 2016)]|uniref:Uncharacterized protein n=1 Tax=Paenibacillus radicis (ex Gao et al. 2016) TaxID=1737354 RepID=A0A917M884_9BACL|nr:hypothetical protein [Paenibacillus radicis (ex Gao et al. 2016)]GGG85416.1 hypothetical protein GCM10010918_49210 [Paenibacillus radicis (ex Gao et al. 2016)]